MKKAGELGLRCLIWVVALVTGFVPCPIACFLPTAHASAPLWSFCLGPGDVPKAFTLAASQPLSNATLTKISHLPAGVLPDLGRLGGYQTTFRRNSLKGISVIIDEVHTFQSARGAEMFDALNVRLIQGLWVHQDFKLLASPHVGDHAWAYSTITLDRGYSFTTFTIYFRRGTYSAHVDAEGLSHSFTMAPVVALARIIDARLHRATKAARPPFVSRATSRVPFLTLGPKDIAHGYRETDRLILTNRRFATLTHIPPRDVQRHGRIWGFGVLLVNSSNPTEFVSAVAAFSSANDATWAYRHWWSLMPERGDQSMREGLKLEHVRPLMVPRVGGGAEGRIFLYRFGSETFREAVILWHRGVFEAEVHETIPSGAVDLREMARLALIEDTRIKRLG